ncbi:ribonuclease P protein subunit P38-related [Striga asiatica]|uniref:Ribonuclease P protein subunit P38-related n=1 Tax=Striga asiatica TaxID=4170 RepID=A0A5A7P2G1_STRAF|nr:ribonuclease P protein subunit P38-related [Striga asiatica]
MAAQKDEEKRSLDGQEQKLHIYNDDDHHYQKLLSSYLGLSFAFFLGSLPRSSIALISSLQAKNKALASKLMRAEEQLGELLSRRKEDSKANARVVEIFASHRHSWQQEEKRLLLQIDECSEEIAYLKGKIEEFEGVEADLKARVEDLRREVGERDEMLNFMSRGGCEVAAEGGDGGGGGERYGGVEVRYGQANCDGGGFSSDYLSSVTDSKYWSEKASLWQDMHYESIESLYNMKHFVSRRESPWKVNGDSTGVSSKLKVLEQELLNLERIGKADLSKVPSQMRKQAKRYQALAGKIDDLCQRMQASDPCETSLSSEFRTQMQTEFLLEAFRLQQRASETNQKLLGLQTETGKSYLEGPAQLATKRSFDSIRNNFKEIQRNLEIWLARIIGDLEGLLARDGASRAREYYVSRYPFVQ